MTGVGLKLPEVQKEGMCRDAAEKRSISQDGFYLTAPSKLPYVPVVILLVPDHDA